MKFKLSARMRMREGESRKGAFTVLMAFLLPVLLIICAFTVNIAYLQLTRTQLMVATDASARAGGRAMSALQDIDGAIAAAENTAALNLVAGSPLVLNSTEVSNDIEFGDAEPSNNSSRFQFEEIGRAALYARTQTASAIRINGRMTEASLTGQVQAFFPTFGMGTDFDLNSSATAMQVDRDIALILDRSGSMDTHPGWAWPSGFNPWTWDPVYAAHLAGLLSYDGSFFYYNSGQNSETLQDWMWTNYLNLGEEPKRPWEELVEAVAVFLDVLEDTDQDEQVSMASYSTSATLDITLQTNYANILTELDTLSPSGWTAIGEGMNTGIPSLLDGYARPFAAKTLLVMTDGVHNQGVDPEVAAQNIVNSYDVIIHTVTFGVGADQSKMQDVASIGGGAHYHADDGEELNDVFEEIANNLPTIVIQ